MLKEMDGSVETDYLYELQVAVGVRGKGLGSALEQVVESQSRCEGAGAVTCTVQKKNQGSMHFHKLKGFRLANNSPESPPSAVRCTR